MAEENYEQLLVKAIKLHSTFNEYVFPVQVLTDITLEDVLSIHHIMNSRGSVLRKKDFEEMWDDIESAEK